MIYRWSKPEELNVHLRKIVSQVSDFHKEINSYKNLEDMEEKITSYFLFLDKCYMGLQEMKIVESGYNSFSKAIPDSVFQMITSVRKLYQNSINEINNKLSEIAEALRPESYKKDEIEIEKVINNKPLKRGIFPREDSIIIYTVFPKDDRYLIFSTLFNANECRKYFNCLNSSYVLPGKYSLGKEIFMVSEIMNNKPESIILYSKLLDKNKIQVKVKEGIKIEGARKIILSNFSNMNIKSEVQDDFIILEFPKLREIEIKEISRILNLSNNDKYLMLSMQGE